MIVFPVLFRLSLSRQSEMERQRNLKRLQIFRELEGYFYDWRTNQFSPKEL